MRSASPETALARGYSFTLDANRRLLPWLGVVFAGGMAVFFMQWGSYVSNAIYGVLIGTIVALLYRTLDVILFTRQNILFTSKQKAMLKVIALIIITTLLLIGETRLNLYCRNYFIFLIKGCGIFALNMAIFFIYSLLTNRAGFSRILELVKERLVRRR